jgi:hypothetical protein
MPKGMTRKRSFFADDSKKEQAGNKCIFVGHGFSRDIKPRTKAALAAGVLV